MCEHRTPLPCKQTGGSLVLAHHVDLGPTLPGASGHGGSLIDTTPAIHNDQVAVTC